MGPWTHCTKAAALPADGVPTAAELELRWLDRFVAARPDDVLKDLAPVNYYLAGEGHWHASASWPPPRASVGQLFLSGAGSGGGGRLQARRDGEDGSDPIVWHPFGGACVVYGLVDTPCRRDERSNDVAVASYDWPITKDTTVSGYLAARLFLSTTASDASVAVRLQDVAPDGPVADVSGGVATLSFRALDGRTRKSGELITLPVHAYTRESVLSVTSGAVYELWVNIWNTAHRFGRGHRLRVAILPSEVTGLPTSTASRKVGVVRIHHGPRYPSALVLTTQGRR
jgi:hypothetical protein